MIAFQGIESLYGKTWLQHIMPTAKHFWLYIFASTFDEARKSSVMMKGMYSLFWRYINDPPLDRAQNRSTGTWPKPCRIATGMLAALLRHRLDAMHDNVAIDRRDEQQHSQLTR
eukprot:scaffold97015_cov36-Prasinocladus_malaysianus.AAC.1